MIPWRNAVRKKWSLESARTVLQPCTAAPGPRIRADGKHLLQFQKVTQLRFKRHRPRTSQLTSKPKLIPKYSTASDNIKGTRTGAVPRPRSLPESSIGRNRMCNAKHRIFPKWATNSSFTQFKGSHKAANDVMLINTVRNGLEIQELSSFVKNDNIEQLVFRVSATPIPCSENEQGSTD